MLLTSCKLGWLALQIDAGSGIELVNERTRQPIQPNVVEFDPLTRQFIVRDYWRLVDTTDNYMWSLPSQFLHNKVLHSLLCCDWIGIAYVLLKLISRGSLYRAPWVM